MIVRNWMQQNPTLVDGDTLLSEAKRILSEHNLQALPVIEGGRLRGVVTRQHCLRAAHFVSRTQNPDEYHFFANRLKVKDMLAEPLRPLNLPPERRVVTQGESGDSLYLVVEGLLEARVTAAGQGETTVGTLRAGDVFGEFSLLTGEPRSASVDTITECRLLEVQRANLEPILSGRPALAGTLSTMLAQRRLDARRTLERLGQGVHPHQALAERMLRRIREVFSLHHTDV